MPSVAAAIEKTRDGFRAWFRRGAAALLLLLILFVAGGGVSQGDRWRINRIEVTGNQVVATEDIRAFAHSALFGNRYFFYSRSNRYFFPKRGIERGLLDYFPRLSDAAMTLSDPHTVTIVVSERKPFALWCGTPVVMGGKSSCWYLDERGFIFDRAPSFSEGVYLEFYAPLGVSDVTDPLRHTVAVEDFAFIRTFLEELRAGGIVPSNVSVLPEGEARMVIYASEPYPALVGAELRFVFDQDAKVIAKNLFAALPVQFPATVKQKKKLRYVDLRFGYKIFFGFET